MALPASGTIDMKDLYVEYYKTLHTIQDIDMASMSSLYGEATTPNAMNEFYSKKVLKTYYSNASRNTISNIVDTVNLNTLGIVGTPVNINVAYSGIIASDPGEINMILDYEKGGIWTNIFDISKDLGDSQVINSSISINSISASDTVQLRLTYILIGLGTGNLNCTLSVQSASGYIQYTPTNTNRFVSVWNSTPSID